MNATERLMATLQACETDRVPVIPELFGVTATLAGFSPADYARSGETIAKSQLAARELIGHDALFAMADLCVEAEALGCGVTFPEDNYPHVTRPIVQTKADIDRLVMPDIGSAGRIPELLIATEILKNKGGDAPVIACVTGPMTVAARVMDIEKMLYMIVDEPDNFKTLISFCESMAEKIISALLDAGADAIMIFDPAASPSVLPEKIFTQFELDPVRSLFAKARKKKPDCITWYSVAGPVHTSESIMTATGADVITVDYVTPIEQAMEKSWPTVVNGNIKPQLFSEGSAEDIQHEADHLLRLARPTERFILGAGCEIPLNARAENIRALVTAAQNEAATVPSAKSGLSNYVNVTILPHRKKISIPRNRLLIDAINSAGISITSYCTNNGSCGRCRVNVKQGNLSAPGNVERLQLSQAKKDLDSGTERLACLARAHGDVTIYIPQESRTRKSRIIRDKSLFDTSIDHLLERYEFAPVISARDLGENGTLHTQGAQRLEWLERQLPDIDLCPELRQNIADLTEKCESPCVAVIDNLQNKIVALSKAGSIYGLAVDIGTSTITVYLCNMENGQLLSVGSIENPQVTSGLDIISRATAATNDPATLARLQGNLFEGINRLIGEFFRDHTIDHRSIYAITVVGNPVIMHLFFKHDPSLLAQAPFTPSISGRQTTTARNLGSKIKINVNPACKIIALPSIEGFVGSDTVAGILGCDILDDDEVSLFIDIGTNGEVVLAREGKLYCTSTASGPVFESLHLSCAYPYQHAVIKSLNITEAGTIEYETAGGVAPIGLCGSSVIDTLAAFIKNRIIDNRGHFINKEKWPQISGDHFVLVPKEKSANFRPITFSSSDIEETQKAISAFKTGIDVLLDQSGLASGDIKKLYISGSFGFSLNVDNARAIGILPDFPNAEYFLIKNSAGIGARIALLSEKALSKTDEIVRLTSHINLANHENFMNLFIDNMFFPSP